MGGIYLYSGKVFFPVSSGISLFPITSHWAEMISLGCDDITKAVKNGVWCREEVGLKGVRHKVAVATGRVHRGSVCFLHSWRGPWSHHPELPVHRASSHRGLWAADTLSSQSCCNPNDR